MNKIFAIQPKAVETMPDILEHGTLYISDKYQTAIHLCACGCGIQTVTPLHCETGWKLEKFNEEMGTLVTLSPSIGNQQFPCGSHYFIKRNRIEWC